jgi:ABC-type transporter Mla subunit MlaD
MGAPVKQMGFDVGEVSGIQLTTIAEPAPTQYIIVTVKVNDEAKIAVDSKAYIQTLGMMGEKYLDVSFGQGQPATKDTLLEGQSQFELDRVIQNTAALTDELMGTVRAFNTTFGDDEFQDIKIMVANLSSISENVNNLVGGATDSINSIMDNLRVASADLSSLIATSETVISNIKMVVEANEKNIGLTLENTAMITSGVRTEVMPDVIALMDDMKGFSGKLDNSMQRANNMIAKLESLVEDNRNDIQTTITNLKDLSSSAKKASVRVNDMLHQDQGLVHDVFYDPEFSASTKETVTQAATTLKSVNTLKDRFSFEAELRYFTDDSRFDPKDSNVRGDLGVQYDITDSIYVYAGGNNLGVTNDLEARFGYRIAQLEFYGGMIESEVAAGAAWHPFERLAIGVEGIGLTDSGKERLDVYTQYQLWEYLYLTGGVQDVTDKVYPNAGILMRF